MRHLRSALPSDVMCSDVVYGVVAFTCLIFDPTKIRPEFHFKLFSQLPQISFYRYMVSLFPIFDTKSHTSEHTVDRMCVYHFTNLLSYQVYFYCAKNRSQTALLFSFENSLFLFLKSNSNFSIYRLY